ncbi:uncharacterized protein N0V89_012532 [Didymosphaeria variabile]|uniref:Uncharacterized protein n=1 Tax=Didymosphaeria variabile TaxID=1932322 RepID=A0A9W9C4J4_9PLEO|nr:uncharacterized protein N0V89_012532 [Didymosphaeria variabile]KAJ4344788.1 hypothetical protein N0V89_012532 [Didymosphaeria variabile]
MSTAALTPDELNGTSPIFQVSPQENRVLVAPTYERLGLNNFRFLFCCWQMSSAPPIITKPVASPTASSTAALTAVPTPPGELDGTNPIFHISPQDFITLAPPTVHRSHAGLRINHLQHDQEHQALSSALVGHAYDGLDYTRLLSSLERQHMTDSVIETYYSSAGTRTVTDPLNTVRQTRIAPIPEAAEHHPPLAPIRPPTSPFLRWTQQIPDPVPVRNLPVITVSPPRGEPRAAFLETDDIQGRMATAPYLRPRRW